jgi:hypothetical protein
MASIPPRHARGYAGEQNMGFFLGERGYFFVEGPSGAGGHGITSAGFDGVAFNPETRQLIIYDNKSFARSGNVASASAIDPRRNLLQNLHGLICRVRNMSGLPNQSEIVDLLKRTRDAVDRGAAWPPSVQIAASNASGRSTGVSSRLGSLGVKFIDYYGAPRPNWRSALGNQNVAGAIGSALGAFAQWLGDTAIEREIRRRLENELGSAVQTILARGHGVLVVIALQEWEMADDQGRRARQLLDVYVEGGGSEQQARDTWERTPRLLKGAPKGWRASTHYAWIPPKS